MFLSTEHARVADEVPRNMKYAAVGGAYLVEQYEDACRQVNFDRVYMKTVGYCTSTVSGYNQVNQSVDW